MIAVSIVFSLWLPAFCQERRKVGGKRRWRHSYQAAYAERKTDLSGQGRQRWSDRGKQFMHYTLIIPEGVKESSISLFSSIGKWANREFPSIRPCKGELYFFKSSYPEAPAPGAGDEAEIGKKIEDSSSQGEQNEQGSW